MCMCTAPWSRNGDKLTANRCRAMGQLKSTRNVAFSSLSRLCSTMFVGGVKRGAQIQRDALACSCGATLTMRLGGVLVRRALSERAPCHPRVPLCVCSVSNYGV
ncbi:hypothetical protein TRVL_07303 [Trypanosoma vivax]|nr:hypothetical protein TRVL_07303 [Trypanosoma vivax]